MAVRLPIQILLDSILRYVNYKKKNRIQTQSFKKLVIVRIEKGDLRMASCSTIDPRMTPVCRAIN